MHRAMHRESTEHVEQRFASGQCETLLDCSILTQAGIDKPLSVAAHERIGALSQMLPCLEQVLVNVLQPQGVSILKLYAGTFTGEIR